MRQTRLKFGLLWAMLLTTPVSALAGMVQGPTPERQEAQRILRDFQAPEWKTRAEAFDRLISLGEGDGSNIAGPVKRVLEKYPNQADQIKLALMRLLERENTRMEELNLRFEKTGQTIGQDYDTDYYANVIASVATLKDIRSMNALLGAITTGGMATDTLAEFAPVSLNPVLAKLEDKNPLVRMCALFVLQEMLLPANCDKVKDPPLRSRIKRAFLRGTRDPDPVVRKRAVQYDVPRKLDQ